MENIVLLQLSENLLHLMRGALLMFFIVMSVSLYPRRRENSILNFLFWLIIVMSLMLIVNIGLLIDGLNDNEQYKDIIKLLDLCLIPLIGGFVLTIVMPDYINSRKALILLILPVIFLFAYILTHNKLLCQLSYAYSILVGVIAFILTIIISIRYDRFLKNNFSDIENKTVRWVRIVVLLFAAWYLVWNFVITLDTPWLDSIYYLFIIFIWTFIYKYSVTHITAFYTKEMFEIYRNNQEITTNQLASKLQLFMDQEKPWINQTLTLRELAIALGSNRTYLSEYFNQTLGLTFYDYLNIYRIRHACELLLSDPNLSVQQVGQQSGFNSLSTFQRAFKKHIGCTPATYRKQD